MKENLIILLGVFIYLISQPTFAVAENFNSGEDQYYNFPIIEGMAYGKFCGLDSNEFRESSCVEINRTQYYMLGLPSNPDEVKALKSMDYGTPITVQFKVTWEFAEEAEALVPMVIPISIRATQ